MRLHRFYISEPVGSQKRVSIASDELANQVMKVFRMRRGDKVVLFDGSGNDFESVISDFGKSNEATITFDIEQSVPSGYMPTRDVVLCAAIVKKDTFEWIAEKATELGVTKIVPIMAERSEKKNLNEDRLLKILKEASEQSGRGTVPVLHPIISLEEALKWVSEKSIQAVMFHTEGEPFTAGKNTLKQGNIEVFIGPEGGWSPKEVEMFHSYKVPVVCLGSQVLRAETAAVAALSGLMLS